MAARDTGPIRIRLNGDRTVAQQYLGIARTQLGILKELMGFNSLPQLTRTVRLADGTVIHCQSVFGQDTVMITPPVRAVEVADEAGAAVVEAVNRVVDYVGVAMPNPVPYRGVSIGVVDNAPTINVTSTTTGSGASQVTTRAWEARHSDGAAAGGGSGTQSVVYDGHALPVEQAGTTVIFYVYSAYYQSYTEGVTLANGLNQFASGGGSYNPQYPCNYTPPPADANVKWWSVSGSLSYTWTGYAWIPTNSALVFSQLSPSYESLLAADQAAETGGARTYVMTSDGTVLASEVQNTSGGHIYYVPMSGFWEGTGHGASAWNGGGGDRMYDRNDSGDELTYSHELTFTVPEDCVYPVPFNTIPPENQIYIYGNYTLQPSGEWTTMEAYWQAGVEAFNTRRTAWFKKNSDETVAALAEGFPPTAARTQLQNGLPASWDYAIKIAVDDNYSALTLADGSFAGRHTVMPIIMSITSAADVIESDTSANLTQAGTKVTRRTTTFQYTDGVGATYTQTIDGRLTQVVTRHNNSSGSQLGLSRQDTYASWYVPTTAPANESLIEHQFIRDRQSYGLGLLWNGVIQQGHAADSTLSTPGNPLAYALYLPPFPVASNTLAGTAPDIFLQYHNIVLPEYVKNTAQSSTSMNNSAMFHVVQIELMPFGLPNLGMFADANETGTQVEVYGKAIYNFDWQTGALTFSSWRALETPAIVTLTDRPEYNCLVGYVWETPDQMWSDVAEYLRTKITRLKNGTWPDPNLYPLIKVAL